MKSQLTSYNAPAIPQWVSDMGLEWLYELLAKSNVSWKLSVR